MTAPPPKKPPTPPDSLAVAAGCARAVELTTPLPTRSLGEEMVERALRDRTADEDGTRSYVLFAEDWRTFIRRQTPDRLAILNEMIDEQIERRAMRRFWGRIYKLGLLIVPAGFAAAQFGMDKLPLIRDIVNLFKKGTP